MRRYWISAAVAYPCGPDIKDPSRSGPSKSQKITERSSAHHQFSPVRIPDYLDMQVSAYSAQPHPESANWEPPGHQETPASLLLLPSCKTVGLVGPRSDAIPPSSMKQVAGRPAQDDQSISPSRRACRCCDNYITHSDQNTSLSVSLSLLSHFLGGIFNAGLIAQETSGVSCLRERFCRLGRSC